MKKFYFNSLRSILIRSTLLFTLFFVAAACSEEDTSVNPILTWIDGEGTVEAKDVFIDFKGINYKSSSEIHSFTADIRDKIVTGTFEVQNFDANGDPVSDASGDIVCIVFEKDCKTARLSGIITAGSDPEFLGLYAVWTIVDNGSTINQTTDIRYPVDPATEKYHCDVGLSLEWYGLKKYFPANGKVNLRSKDCN